MGFWHARALTRTGATLALVVDRDLDRAQRFARPYRGCDVASTLDGLSTHRIDVAHICTPTSSHAALVETALDAGCHVLVEKPLAADEATTRALVGLAESRRRLLCPVHQVLFQRGVRQTLAVLEHLRPLHLDLVMCSAGAEGRSHAEDDLVSDILPHPLSFLCRALPSAAASGRWTVSAAGPGELRATLTSEVGTASILISAHGRPTVNAARVIGERGTAHLDFFHGFAVFQGGGVSRRRKALQPFVFSAGLGAVAAWNLMLRAVRRQSAYPGLWELVSAFYRQLGPEGVSPVSVTEIGRTAAMRDAVLSARSAAPLFRA